MSNPAFKFDHVHIISENREHPPSVCRDVRRHDRRRHDRRGAPQIFVDLAG